MFFFLSKTLGIMLLPVNFLIGVGVLGAILLATRLAMLGRRLLVASVVLLAICGFSPLGKLCSIRWSSGFRHGMPRAARLTASSSSGERSTRSFRPRMGGRSSRIRPTASSLPRPLARQYPNARIVFSGGNANLVSDDTAKEADYALAVFESLGIARERLTTERRSRNTQENAEFSKAIANPKDGERWLLVTSAYHMPRSVGLFRKAGFAVEPYPVDWRVDGPGLLTFSPMAIEGLERTDIARARMDRSCRLLGHRQDRRVVAGARPELEDRAVATGGQSG